MGRSIKNRAMRALVYCAAAVGGGGDADGGWCACQKARLVRGAGGSAAALEAIDHDLLARCQTLPPSGLFSAWRTCTLRGEVASADHVHHIALLRASRPVAATVMAIVACACSTSYAHIQARQQTVRVGDLGAQQHLAVLGSTDRSVKDKFCPGRYSLVSHHAHSRLP